MKQDHIIWRIENMKQLLRYVVCVLMVELCGFVVGMMTRDGTAIYRDTIAKPPLSPAPIAFPIPFPTVIL